MANLLTRTAGLSDVFVEVLLAGFVAMFFVTAAQYTHAIHT
jgi:hypothetical protein